MSQNKGQKNQQSSETIEVLYQKMGNRWFAFSVQNDEVFVGSISQEEIDGAGQDHAVENQIHARPAGKRKPRDA